ncbi:hypothetical protein [Sphingomonas quercus]|uniref:Glycosyl transferase n=1 Tax=Sphingomonas quercus TaxID=2842451 RepID=A0ABS6BGJ3_9SPHN|nr:hypothetical protein [Sphingomonas quercus]MBU3077415.1 hypothetical protein [Sphingomonas quercus]
MRSGRRPKVAFLFLGETLLVPHLWPIAERLATMAPDVDIDIWVSTSVHEALIGGWLAGMGTGQVRIRRAPGYRRHPELLHGENPPLPPKLPMLAGLLPHLLRAAVVVCAERTSLWLPRALPFLPLDFIMTQHGAGPVAVRGDKRRDAAKLLIVPSEIEKALLVQAGHDGARIHPVGYVKSGFRHGTDPRRLFATARPTLVYAPHWQRHRSSWWNWGREVVAMLAAQDRWNVILAPHQRLAEKDPAIVALFAGLADLPHVHADLHSFAMVDGSYMRAADLYLGDTSSQVVEFLASPRPCVFLNSHGVDWRAREDHHFWEYGQVIDRLDDLSAALDSAPLQQPRFEAAQRAFASRLGEIGDAPAERAAALVLAAARG